MRCALLVVVLTLTLAVALSPHPAAAQALGDQIRRAFVGAVPAPPRLVMVFADISSSIAPEDWRVYERRFLSLVGSAEADKRNKPALQPGAKGQAGDRLILATISEATLVGFVAVTEGELRDTGHLFPDREANEKVLKKLSDKFLALRQAKPAQRSHILDALTVDIAFLFDATGSMRNIIGTVQRNAVSILEQLRAKNPNTAFGVASFGDYGGSEPVWALDQDITADTTRVIGAA
jgi:hypothetical protein